ncbi:MAG: beta-ketoacyl synthase N-terminal-like domain-containing protein, partial [Acidobacteria bacterium]|nr:beta-ketoacyl synthase N-terminal-like domain-containing protein [Acidobacteriota bacterium]
MPRRVVITGIGCVSPNGIGREEFWRATQAGESGVRTIEKFDATPWGVTIAGQVPREFDE